MVEAGGGDSSGGDDGGDADDGAGVCKFVEPLDTTDEIADDDVWQQGCESEEAESPEHEKFSENDLPAG